MALISLTFSTIGTEALRNVNKTTWYWKLVKVHAMVQSKRGVRAMI